MTRSGKRRRGKRVFRKASRLTIDTMMMGLKFIFLGKFSSLPIPALGNICSPGKTPLSAAVKITSKSGLTPLSSKSSKRCKKCVKCIFSKKNFYENLMTTLSELSVLCLLSRTGRTKRHSLYLRENGKPRHEKPIQNLNSSSSLLRI